MPLKFTNGGEQRKSEISLNKPPTTYNLKTETMNEKERQTMESIQILEIKETYSSCGTCSNCAYNGEVKIPVGLPIADFTCINCGCKTWKHFAMATYSPLHPIQQKMLKLLDSMVFKGKTLRSIGTLIGEESPEKIKHHIVQLQKRGFLDKDRMPTEKVLQYLHPIQQKRNLKNEV